MWAFVNIGSSSMRTQSKQPVHEQKKHQRAGFTAARGFHSSTRVSQQHASFTAACGFHSSMRASQQHASFTVECKLHSSMRASQQHASFTCNSIRLMIGYFLATNDCVTTTVANKEIDSHQHSGKLAESLSCMQWKQDVRFLSRMVYRRCMLAVPDARKARPGKLWNQSKDTSSKNMTGFIEMMTFTITASTFISYAGCLGTPYAVCVHVRIAALDRKYFALTQYACDIVKRTEEGSHEWQTIWYGSEKRLKSTCPLWRANWSSFDPSRRIVVHQYGFTPFSMLDR